MKIAYFFIGVLLALFSFWLSTFGLVQNLEAIFEDKLQAVYTSPVRKDITIVAIDDKSLFEIGAWPWDRAVFAEILGALDISGARVIGFDITFLDEREGDFAFQTAIRESNASVVLASKVVESQHLIPVLESSHLGFTNILQDSDGIVRFALLEFFGAGEGEGEAEKIPSFASGIYRAYAEKHPRKTVLLDWKAQLRDPVRFIYGAGSFSQISVADLLSGNFDEAQIKDRIVLVGSTAKDLRTGLVDNISRVGGVRISGVELHAYIVSALLNKGVLFEVPFAFHFLIFLFFISALFLIFRMIKKPINESILAFCVCFAIIVLSIVLFDYGILFPGIAYILGVFLTAVFSLAFRYLEEKKSRRFISRAFSQYMNEELLELLMKNPKLLKLGGTKKQMTILFSDIRGFTALSESLTPEELVGLLNAYLDKMSRVIFANFGIIDKFIGDAVMAFWNSPISDSKHALHAVCTAIAMVEALKEFNAEQKGPTLAIGIGVHTGEVIVGNMGSTKRFDFTVIGDNVNLAARLEGLTKKYGVGILISGDTLEACGAVEGYVFRKIDEVIVKGKSKAVAIYEPLVDCDVTREIKESYEKAFGLYQRGNFAKALSVLKKNLDDKPSRLLDERIRSLGTLPVGWSGAWRWEEK